MKHLNAFPATLIFLAVCFFSITFGLSPASGQKQKPFLVGGNFDVTGYAAWLGEPELRAAQLFVERINARGGVNGRPCKNLNRE